MFNFTFFPQHAMSFKSMEFGNKHKNQVFFLLITNTKGSLFVSKIYPRKSSLSQFEVKSLLEIFDFENFLDVSS